MTESSTTAAPTTPIGAARMVPITMTATASPPGTRLSRISVATSMSLAEPERSRIDPMKMNIGIETSTGSTATPPHMRSRMLDSVGERKHAEQPADQSKSERRAPHHECDRVAAKDDDEHRDEHEEGEIVGEPLQHARPYASSSAWPICSSTSARDRPPNRYTIRRSITLTTPSSSSHSPM